MHTRSHEATRKTAHPLLNTTVSFLSCFPLRVLFPGEIHPRNTGQTPCRDPWSRPVPAATPSHIRPKPYHSPKGCHASKSSQAPGVLSLGAANLLGLWFALEHFPAVQPRGRGPEEKLLSRLSAKHYMVRAPCILTISILGSQMTSFPADIPSPTCC